MIEQKIGNWKIVATYLTISHFNPFFPSGTILNEVNLLYSDKNGLMMMVVAL